MQCEAKTCWPGASSLRPGYAFSLHARGSARRIPQPHWLRGPHQVLGEIVDQSSRGPPIHRALIGVAQLERLLRAVAKKRVVKRHPALIVGADVEIDASERRPSAYRICPVEEDTRRGPGIGVCVLRRRKTIPAGAPLHRLPVPSDPCRSGACSPVRSRSRSRRSIDVRTRRPDRAARPAPRSHFRCWRC